MAGETKPCVLVTGASGFIGSHTVVELINAGYEVVGLDILINSFTGIQLIIGGTHGHTGNVIGRLEKMTHRPIKFLIVDLTDEQALDEVFRGHRIDYVIHFAALKSVGDSVHHPLRYYENNLVGLLNLLKVMSANNCKNLVFSSSCTVYGNPKFLPLTETHPIGDCVNPYGATKFFSEVILRDVYTSDPSWNIVSLRYFNPIGAHPSGEIGEDPVGEPSNLMPYISQVAVGQRPEVTVFGGDYDTRDGTGVRDYIHVVDLAQAHTSALSALDKKCGYKVYNLGTGTGYSVMEVIKAMEKACGRKIPYKIGPRRQGDTATVYADPSLAEEELGWKAKFDLDKMCEDQWNWQSRNPHGYREHKEAGDI